MDSDRQSLKKKILFPLVAVLVAALAFVTVEQMTAFKAHLTIRLKERGEHISSLVHFIAGSSPKTGELQHLVATLGGEPEVNLITVLAGEPARVVASSRMALLGKSLEQVSDPEVRRDLREAMTVRSSTFRFDGQDEDFDYFRPLSVASNGPGGQRLERGVVMVSLDMHPLHRELLETTAKAIAGYSATALLLAFSCWLLLRRQVVQPVLKIGHAVAGFQAGEVSRLLDEAHFPRELAQLADAWNGLVAQLQEENRERTKAEEALRRSRDELDARVVERTAELVRTKERLQYLVTSNPAIIYSLKIVEGGVEPTWVSDNILPMTGYTSQESLASGWWLGRLHPHDRERILTELGGPFVTDRQVAEYRFQRRDGTYFWIRDERLQQWDASGAPAEMVGSWVDITERKNAEETLRENEEMLRRVMASNQDCIKILDLEGRLVWMNEGGQSIMEIDDFKTVKDQRWVDFWPAKEQPAVLAALEHAKNNEVGKFSGSAPTAKGSPHWWEVVVTPMLDHAGIPEKLLCVSRNITERKQVEDALRASEQQFSSAFKYATIGMTLVAPDGRFVKVNHALCQMVGYPEAELLGLTFQQITHADDLAADLGHTRDLLAGTIASYQMDKRYFHKAGHLVWIHLSVSLVRDEAGQPVHFIAQIQDITDRRQAEMDLRLNEQRYRSLVKATTAIVWDTPASGEFEVEQPGWSAFTGQSFEELRGWGWLDAIHPDDQAETTRVWSAAVASRDIYKVEHRLRFHDQTYRNMRVRAVPILAEDGMIVQWIGIHTDITERKRAEEALQRHQTELRVLFDLMPALIWFKDTENGTLRANQRAADAAGKSVAEMEGKSMYEIYPDEAAKYYADDLTVIRTKAPKLGIVEQLRDKHGRAIWIRTDKVPYFDQAGEVIGIVVVAQDITARREAEQLQARFAAIMEATTDFVGVADGEGRVLYVNPAGRKMIGIGEQEDVTATSIADYSAEVDLHRTMQESIPTAIREGVWSGEAVFASRDGRDIPIAQEVVVRKAPNGEVEFMAITAQDLTGRKKAEAALEDSHRRLQEASRQAGMAEVATSVLHNVGNVLNSVNISASVASEKIRRSCGSDVTRVAALLQKHRGDLPEFLASAQGLQLPDFLTGLAEHLAGEQSGVLAELRSLCANIDHIKDIVEMQQASARFAGVTEALAPASLIEDALRLNAAAFERHGVEIVREYGEAPVLEVDKHKALQILVNLIRNAKHAMTEPGGMGKRLTLKIARDDAGFVEISVGDEGVGIPAENLTRIFEHGFTTRKDGHGFGLHSAALAAQEMGGSLTVQSDGHGKGAVFTLALPLRGERSPLSTP